MSRPIFFLVITVVGLLFAGFMLLAPAGFAQNAGLAASPETSFVFRALGSAILSVSLLNFMVRNNPDSDTLAAILWMNIALHVLAVVVDFIGVGQGLVTIGHAAPGLVVHALIAIGAYVYIARMKTA